MHRTTHPSKEQVRAYMHRREGAHTPPPAPEEIRRLLGWRCLDCARCEQLVQFDSFHQRAAWSVLPLTIGQLGMLMTFEWLCHLSTFHHIAVRRR